MSLVITTRPPAEPVTLDEIKEHLNIDYEVDEYDSLLELMIKAARGYCEKYLGRTLIRTSYSYSFNRFPADKIVVPKAPLISVESITYFDTNSSPNTQTVATTVYGVDLGVCPGIIYLKYGQNWPTSRGHHNDVTVNFTSGYVDSIASPRDFDDQMPEEIKAAMKLVVGNMYMNREQKMDIQTYHNDTAEMLLDPYKLRSVS